MSKRKRGKRAASGEPRQPMDQPQGNRQHRPDRRQHQPATAKPQPLTERERELLELFKSGQQSERYVFNLYTAERERRFLATKFICDLGLFFVFEDYKQDPTQDKTAMLQTAVGEIVSEIVSKIAASR